MPLLLAFLVEGNAFAMLEVGELLGCAVGARRRGTDGARLCGDGDVWDGQ